MPTAHDRHQFLNVPWVRGTPTPPPAGDEPSYRVRQLLDEPARTSAAIEPTLSRVRWATLLAIFVLTVAWQFSERTGFPPWLAVLLAGGYNLGVELMRRVPRRPATFAQVAILDLGVVSLIFFAAAKPNGPIFLLYLLGIVSAALTLSMRGTILYWLAVALAIAGIAPTLPGWSASAEDIQEISLRILVLGFVALNTAIVTRWLTLEHQRAEQMRGEAERLEELDRLRADFIASVSHDLKTPLTAVRAGLGLLVDLAAERLQPVEQGLLNNVRRNVERLDLLIADLLTLNQLERGTLHLDRAPLDLRDVVDDAAVAVRLLVQEKGQELHINLPVALPVEGDDHRLEQVVANLLSNAHRHTPPGTRIDVSGVVEDGQVVLAVRDNGPGIPPEALERVFKPFLRQAPSGAGLGLTITRAIAGLHGGRIWAESKPGQGAAFFVSLPCRRRE
jgi:signal transduction histidine kinase